MDLPEVSLVAILDADREGYLRSYGLPLIQIMGRAARNINSTVYLYADKETESIRKAVDETIRRRKKQLEFNRENGIVPRNIEKEVTGLLPQELLEAYSPSPSLRRRGSRKESRRFPSRIWSARCGRPSRNWTLSGPPPSAI